MTRAEAIRWLLGTFFMVLVWRIDSGIADLVAIVLIAVFGLPHGAADALLIRRRWPRFLAWTAITSAYAIIAVASALFFFQFPAIGLAIFILISIWHFGSLDSRGMPSWSIFGAGGVFIFGPFLLWGPEINSYLSQLGLSELHRSQLLTVAPWLLAVCIVTLMLAALMALPIKKPTLFGIALTVPIAILLPPLLSFSLYFSLLHAPRHSADLSRYLAGWWRQPRVLIAVLLTWIVAGIWIAYGNSSDISERTVTALIIGMAALTVPHMLLNFLITEVDSALSHSS
jgi:beta-carotene 15,15'-dioxygenase